MAPLRRALTLLLVAAQVWAASGTWQGRPSVYQPPSPRWTAPILSVLPGSSAAGDPTLAALSVLAGDAQKQALAPLVYHLGKSLRLKPEAFAALPPDQRAAALAMAAEEARGDVINRAYGLVGASRGLLAARNGVDRDLLVDLHASASNLQEIHKHYGAFLGEDERKAVAEAAAQTSARYLEARAAFLERFGQETAEALTQGSARAPPRLAEGSGVHRLPAKPRAKPYEPTRSAMAKLEELKANKVGWSAQALGAVYESFGFKARESGHIVYYHPDYPQIGSEAVSRQKSLSPAYARSAIALIEALLQVGRDEPPALAASALDPLADLPPVPAAAKAAPKAPPVKRVVALQPLVQELEAKPSAPAEESVLAAATPTTETAEPEISLDAPAPPAPAAVPETMPAPPSRKRSRVGAWLRRNFGGE